MKIEFNNPDYKIVRSYRFCDIMDAGIDLTKFSESDWEYAVVEDCVYVKPKSVMQSWLALKGLFGIKTAYNNFNKNW